MSGKYFLDTNIIVYSFDQSDQRKQSIAQGLIREAIKTGQGIISYQVIQEFLNVATRKFTKSLSIPDSKEYLFDVLEPLCEVFPSFDLYHNALDISGRWQYSFDDAMIISAALHSGCEIVYSEDFQHNLKIQRLRIENPFIS